MTVLGAGQGLLGHGRAPPNHTIHRPATSLPSPGNWSWGHLVDPLTRPSSNGTHLGGYLGPRPARSRLSPNEESGAAASVVDESGHLTCLRLAHGGPAAAQCSSSGARGPDGSRAARRRSSGFEPHPRTCDCESDGGVKPYGPRHKAPRRQTDILDRAGHGGRKLRTRATYEEAFVCALLLPEATD